MPLHWIYDAEKIKELVGEKESPAFFEPPSCPFYTYETGEPNTAHTSDGSGRRAGL